MGSISSNLILSTIMDVIKPIANTQNRTLIMVTMVDEVKS
jgi:hypothetical protein